MDTYVCSVVFKPSLNKCNQMSHNSLVSQFDEGFRTNGNIEFSFEKLSI